MKKALLLLLAVTLLAGGGIVAQDTAPPGEPAKDPNPPAGGPGTRVPCPGPDLFGYTCDDTVPFMMADISGTGAQIVVGDDVSSGAVPLGGTVPFDYYGTAYTSLNMASNGYITTDPSDTGPDLSNDCPIPSPPSTGGGGRMYPLHDDLDLEAGIGAGYYEYFATCPRPVDRTGIVTGCHVFQWNDVSHWPGGGGAPVWDQWVILYDTYDMTFQVGTGNPETGSGSTTGIQDTTFSDGLLYACNSAGSIPDDFAITIFHPNPNLPVPTMAEWAKVGLALALVVIGLISLGAIRRQRLA